MLAFSTVVTCLIISAAAKAGNNKKVPTPGASPRPKLENVFNRTRAHDLGPQEIPGATDFLESTVTLLGGLKNGSQVEPEQLNHFSAGLKQYYLSKAYEYYFANATRTNETYTDPVCMPNATSENVEFYRVKVYGFPGFKKNARVRRNIDSSPFVKNYTVHFNATSDVTIINGGFKIYDEQYYFVYHTYNNVYTTRVNVIRTNDGLLKPKSTVDVFAVQREIFVHTYDRTQEQYAKVNATVYPKFKKILRDIYMPKLATFVDGILRPSFPDADVEFGQLYRLRLREVLLRSAREYLLGLGHVRHEFSPEKMTRETIIPGMTAVYTYTAKMYGYLDYETYEFNSTQSEANGTSLLMYDVVTLRYPQHVCNMTVVVLDHKNATYDETFEIRSVDIMIAYQADLSAFPIRVRRNLDRWKFLQTGFFSKFDFWKINPFYNFVAMHAQVEFAKLIATLFEPDD